MGVVFTTLFAIGLILIRQAADHVDLDPSCVLYGAIELSPLDTVLLFGHDVPRVAITSEMMLIVNSIFVMAVFFKPDSAARRKGDKRAGKSAGSGPGRD